ncbi:hypothetical protein [Mucilaginibacter lacusdianchii]|uniref:hypothetical protein n=1 Tax=Mucilaginibacter lacusdianchii TaxID=2684211 RepID=UPI00131C62E4|nr:hypothetical protein [Mucilaginibacter sp. JXJ CY 39]
MLAFNQEALSTDEDVLTRRDELQHGRFSRAEAVDPEDDDDLDNDDLDLDDDDLDDDDLDADDDIVPDYDEDLDDEDLDEDEDEDYNRITGEAETSSTGIPESYDDDEPNEIPEQGEADNEDLRYPSEDEVPPSRQDDEGSFSEQTDVTPPRPQEFPSVGRAETDFTSRDQGRTTGRMIGHEPGTEGI